MLFIRAGGTADHKSLHNDGSASDVRINFGAADPYGLADEDVAAGRDPGMAKAPDILRKK